MSRTTTSPPPSSPAADRSPQADAGGPADRDHAEMTALNARARAGAVTDTLHGVAVPDPYRALEEDSPLTREWIEHQTARAERYLAAHARPGIETRLAELLAIGALSAPSAANGRLYYTRRDGTQEQPVLVVAERDGGRASAPFTVRTLVDPADGSFGERAAIDWYYASPRGRYVAFGVSRNGDERSTLYVLDLGRVGAAPPPAGHGAAHPAAAAVRLPIAIPNTKWTQVAWLPDESGFYYTRYPRAGEPHHDPAQPDAYWKRVHFHDLRAGAADGAGDAAVFAGEAATDSYGLSVSDDARWLVINLFRGWSHQDVYLIDRHAPLAHASGGAAPLPVARPVVTGRPALSTGFVYRGRMYVYTDLGAPRYRVLAAEVARAFRDGLGTAAAAAAAAPTTAAPAAGAHDAEAFALAPAGPWTVVVPETADPLASVRVAHGGLALLYRENIVSRLRLAGLDGRPHGEVALPGEGTVEGISGRPDDPTLAVLYSSFFEAPVMLSVAVPAAGHTTAPAVALAPPPSRSAAPSPPLPAGPPAVPAAVVDRVQTDFDASRYALSREAVRSRDGTPVNVFYMHRRDLVRDGSNPVIVYGYGGFNIPMLPAFTRHPLYWLERGGVYAVANLRGGSEFGEEWHRAGALSNKEHVFEDFEAVLRWFAASGISAPGRIAIHGGSNGGLLVGALVTRAPDAFRAGAAHVGLYDMVRYHRFPPAELWISEYGSADDAAQFPVLYAYSPYHRVRDGVRYPATWVETADHDSRVYWGHSTKFAARLQEAQAGPLPVFFYMQRNIGHGAGTRLTDLAAKWARMYTFFEDQLGLPPH